MTITSTGRGRPATLVVPGEGRGPSPSTHVLAAARWFAAELKGTSHFFYYEESGRFKPVKPLRRQADRDAEEARLVADASGATRALCISRGARAIAGLLANNPGRFERVVLVVPPGDLRTPQAYRIWLDSLPVAANEPPAPNTEILVLGLSGDRSHPQRSAEDWAGRLGARLNIFPARSDNPEHEPDNDEAGQPQSTWGEFAPGYALMRNAAAQFLNA